MIRMEIREIPPRKRVLILMMGRETMGIMAIRQRRVPLMIRMEIREIPPRKRVLILMMGRETMGIMAIRQRRTTHSTTERWQRQLIRCRPLKHEAWSRDRN